MTRTFPFRPVPLVFSGLLAVLVVLFPGQAAEGSPALREEREPAGPAELDPGALAEREWERLATGDILEFVRDLQAETGDLLPGFNRDGILGIVRGEGLPFTASDFLRAVFFALFGAVAENITLLGRLVLLAVLLAVLRLLQSAFESETVSSVASSVVFLAMLAVALVAFSDAVEVARDLVDSLVDFMLAILPLLVGLLASSGALVSAGLLSPLTVMLVNGVGWIAANWAIPLIFLGTILNVANRMPGRVRVDRLASLIRQAGVMALTFSLLVFLGTMAVQGAAGGVADGVLLRTAKFSAGAFIPVLGGMFADAAELVVSSSLLLKSGIGILGTVVVAMLAVFPLLKILALVLTFRLAAALVQPIAEGPFVQALEEMGSGLMLIGLAAGAASLMFFLALGVLVGVGSAVAMMR